MTNTLAIRRSFIWLSLAGLILSGSQALAQSDAQYDVLFEVTWSNQTHPWPTFPSSAHLTTLVGATHNTEIEFWAANTLATPGVRQVAETGATRAFSTEIDDAVAAAQADALVLQGVPFGAPEETTFVLDVSASYPRLTLLTMVAPSPDWFAGVAGLNLQDADGQWRDLIELELFPYDAGTEDGDEYSLSNPPTIPAENIRRIRGEAPFSTEPVARLTLVRVSDSIFANSFESAAP